MVSATVGVDLRDGGRWTSLHLGGAEWLWAGPGLVSGPRTGRAVFTDAGGLDECFPTVRGTPDHGGLWNQVWTDDGEWDAVRWDDVVLRRRMNGGTRPDAAPLAVPRADTGAVWADYELTAPPGYQFVWAAHALLDCAVGASVDVPDKTACRLYPDEGPWVEGDWSSTLSTYGPSDGTAVGAVLVDCPSATVRDRGMALTFELSCPGQPVSTAVWRNLEGFPAGAPYRSLGVEPMLGRVFDLAEAGPGDAAVVPDGGRLTWRLVVSARPA
ncbi:hypothetical protein BWI15_18520 [Kribbella sp. ALI-6-A]|uniref:hypothetical protein n=1 Tax=Kribbella sp. ALI-6-A TaxID=1933817 RepID=UPI00097CA08D|nr:hypothetical protein [Kribbella sp. ALI-6-A]ONI72076.1 hypothetical protein BWI15_18520 [Kribbella sp. ALI-6-A]